MFNGKKASDMDLLKVPTKIIPTKQSSLHGPREQALSDDEEGGLGYTHTLVSDDELDLGCWWMVSFLP